MEYVGLHTQIRRNNIRSILLLIGFPLLILLAVYVILFFAYEGGVEETNWLFIQWIPLVLIGVATWFAVAYFAHTNMIRFATKSRSLSRKENMRVYNLTENLCMSVGMTMPKLNVIDSPALNAFASGIDQKSYAVTLTTGIIEHLNDEELEGVIAHELSHIRNRDVRLLIVSIVFVGIFSFVMQIAFRSFLWGGGRRRNSKDNNDGKLLIIIMIVSAVVYFFSILFRFAISRSREYMADAGAVSMTKNSLALASALRKISGNHQVDVQTDDVKEMFIENTPDDSAGIMSSLGGLFATHPPIEKRIAILERGL